MEATELFILLLFQLVEQVELLLKGTSVPPLGPSSPAPGAGLAGAFVREMTAPLPGMAVSGTAWAGTRVELCFGDNVVSAAALEHAARQQSRYGRATACLATRKQFTSGLS